MGRISLNFPFARLNVYEAEPLPAEEPEAAPKLSTFLVITAPVVTEAGVEVEPPSEVVVASEGVPGVEADVAAVVVEEQASEIPTSDSDTDAEGFVLQKRSPAADVVVPELLRHFFLLYLYLFSFDNERKVYKCFIPHFCGWT